MCVHADFFGMISRSSSRGTDVRSSQVAEATRRTGSTIILPSPRELELVRYTPSSSPEVCTLSHVLRQVLLVTVLSLMQHHSALSQVRYVPSSRPQLNTVFNYLFADAFASVGTGHQAQCKFSLLVSRPVLKAECQPRLLHWTAVGVITVQCCLEGLVLLLMPYPFKGTGMVSPRLSCSSDKLLYTAGL